VGLGFGLQEIFANLVSGIILLFERPIRVGDTVTIGDIDGKVSRIQMRATTIVSWDQKELIVPNKSFITEKLVNWSLSDTIIRIVIPVGVAYDSDVDQVKTVLEQVLSDNPSVLKDPAPEILFLEFGDSSLNFSIRVFIQNLEKRLPVMNELHRQIKIAFDKHNINIPFPQRDINLHSNFADSFQSTKPL
jgi:potassium efflux system protein